MLPDSNIQGETESRISNSNRRTFLKGSAATLSLTAFAGCLGGDEGSGLPTLTYASIPGSVAGDRFQRFMESDMMRDEVLPHMGEEYDVEFIPSDGSVGVVEAMAADEAVTGQLAFSSAANAVLEDRIDSGFTIISPMKLITDGWGAKDTYCTWTGSDIETIADLEGREFAVNSFGSAVDISARMSLLDAGLEPEEDVAMREIGFGAMAAALEEERVDVGTFLLDLYLADRDNLNVIFDNAESITNYAQIFYTVRNDFLEENEEMVEMMLEDLWMGHQWWHNDASDEEKIDVFQEVSDLPDDVIRLQVEDPEQWEIYGGHDGLAMEAESIQDPVDAMEETGFIDDAPDMSQFLDNSYLPEEAQQPPSLGGF